jgi:integration host factor subunit beta
MNKTELIARLARKQTNFPKKDAKLAVDQILKLMRKEITAGGRIEIRGFGTFTLRYRPGQVRFNLRTGENNISSASHALHFKPAKELRLRVDAYRRKTETFAGKPLTVTSRQPKLSTKKSLKRWAKAS